jgi:hypothetical protein
MNTTRSSGESVSLVASLAGDGPVERTTRLAKQLIAGFAIQDSLMPRLTRLQARDNLTNVRQWLAQFDPELLHRDPDAVEWGEIIFAFAETLRDLGTGDAR